MKISITLLSFLALSITACAQGFFVKKDGTQVPYESFKSKKEGVLIKRSGDDLMIPYKEVIGCYDSDEAIFIYCKPERILLNENQDTFIRKIIAGKISVYQNQHTSTYHTGSAVGGSTYMKTTTILKAEKLSWYGQIFPDEGVGKEMMRENMKTLMKDSPAFLEKLEKGYKLKINYLLDLITAYNFEEYRAPRIDAKTSYAEVVFYRGDTDQVARITGMTVADTTLTFGIHTYEIAKIPGNVPLIACLGTGSDNCYIIEVVPYFRSYYEVGLTSKGKYSLKQQTRKKALRELEQMKSWKGEGK